MKKWLVGLVCLGVCVAGALGQTVLLEEGFDTLTTNEVPAGWTSSLNSDLSYGATYSGLAAPAYKFRAANQTLTSPAFLTGATDLSFYAYGNNGSNSILTIEGLVGSTWSFIADVSIDQNGKSYDVVVPDSQVTQLKFTFKTKVVNFSLDDVVVTSSGPAVFSISLNPATAFTVEQDDSATITATANNAAGTVTYNWSTVPAGGGSGSGNTFTVDSSALGSFVVTCQASDGTDTASKDVAFTVVEPSEDPDLLIDFSETKQGTPSYTDTTFTSSGVDLDILRCYGESDGVMRVQYYNTDGVNGYVQNADAFEEAITRISFDYKRGGTGANHAGKTWILQVSETGSGWTTIASIETGTDWETEDVVVTDPDMYYFRITGEHSGSTALLLHVDNIGFWFGPVSTDPYITSSGSTNGTTGDEMELEFTLHNATATSWSADLGNITSAGVWTWTPSATGSYAVEVVASDGTGPVATNTVNLSVSAPLQSYSITITPPANGSVTTDPSGSALEGSTVAIIANADDGYVVGTITVNGTAISGTTFTMPSAAATIVVTFVEYTGPDVLIDFNETKNGDPKYTDVTFTSCGVDLEILRCYGESNGMVRLQYLGHSVEGTNGYVNNATAFAAPIDRIQFSYKPYTNNSTHLNRTWMLQASSDGVVWESVGTFITDGEVFTTYETWDVYDVGNIPPGMFYFRITCEQTGSQNRMVNIDNIGIWFSTSTDPYIASSGSTSGTVGEEMELTFTLHNATATSWSADLGSITSAGVWTWTPSAVGPATLKVVASDGTGPVATNTVNLTVSAPLQSYSITITPPVNGSVTTDPSGSAQEGSMVTITATPDTGYILDTIYVNGEESAATFTMPSANVTIVVTFKEYSDTATLPFFHGGAWSGQQISGVTMNGLRPSDYAASGYDGYPGAGFTNINSEMIIKFDSMPGELSYYIRGQTLTGEYSFKVEESVDGTIWEDVQVFDNTTLDNTLQKLTNTLASASRYVRFWFETKGGGNIGIAAVGITSGSTEPRLTYSGDTVGTVGVQMTGTFTPHNFNPTVYSASHGQIGDLTGVWTYTPATAGSFTLEVGSSDGIGGSASLNVPFTVLPAGGGDGDITYTGDITIEAGESFSIQFALNMPGQTAQAWTADLSGSGTPIYDCDITAAGLFTWSPSSVGSYSLTVTAYADTDLDVDIASLPLTLMVTGTTPLPDATISEMKFENGKLVITLDTDAVGTIVIYGASEISGSNWDFDEENPLTYTLDGDGNIEVEPITGHQILKIGVQTN